MSIFDDLYNFSLLPKWQTEVEKSAKKIIENNGNLKKWLGVINKLPNHLTDEINFTENKIIIGNKNNISKKEQDNLKNLLLKFSPWRKGSFEIFGIDIDTEWRSDFKWNRIKNHINLTDKRVLDVGCGNGYFMLKMLGANAKKVVGIDPSVLSIVQFLVLRKFIKTKPNAMIFPFKLEDLPTDLESFDTIFSMGVLYHRRSPLDHLSELKNLLVKNGELILETLVADGGKGYSLMPKNRYAKMRNVWFIPSVGTLKLWLKRIGFSDIRILDTFITSLDEQRKTEWMNFESLADFLDPSDKTKTIEGYPAPKRVVIIAKN